MVGFGGKEEFFFLSQPRSFSDFLYVLFLKATTIQTIVHKLHLIFCDRFFEI
jgi:hypothetical protein